jgi:hypothetical protein
MGSGADRSARRGKVLKQARVLARSGIYSDSASIAAAVCAVDGFKDARRWFEDARFLAQLSSLCAMSQDKRSFSHSNQPCDHMASGGR